MKKEGEAAEQETADYAEAEGAVAIRADTRDEGEGEGEHFHHHTKYGHEDWAETDGGCG